MKIEKFHDISAFCSTDPARFPINGVHVCPDKGYIEATCGRCLLRLAVAKNENDELKECIIPAKQFSEVCKSSKKEPTFAKSTPAGDAVFYTVSSSKTLNAVEGVFPNATQVIPTETPKFKIAFSAELLGRFCDYAAKHSTEKNKTIVFEFTDELSPVFMRFKVGGKTEFDTPNALGVLMPVRTV